MTASPLRSVPDVDASKLKTGTLRPAARRRRYGLAALGLLFILVAALAAAILVQSLRSSVSVLVLASDIEAGEILDATKVVVAQLGSDGLGQIDFVDAERQSDVVGLRALGPMPAGSVLSRSMFGSSADVVPAGKTVVGVVLVPGALPAGVVHSGSAQVNPVDPVFHFADEHAWTRFGSWTG